MFRPARSVTADDAIGNLNNFGRGFSFVPAAIFEEIVSNELTGVANLRCGALLHARTPDGTRHLPKPAVRKQLFVIYQSWDLIRSGIAK